MAVGGGACSAYRLWLVDGQPVTKSTTRLRSECVRPNEAVKRALAGEEVIVEGSDIVDVRNEVIRRLREGAGT